MAGPVGFDTAGSIRTLSQHLLFKSHPWRYGKSQSASVLVKPATRELLCKFLYWARTTVPFMTAPMKDWVGVIGIILFGVGLGLFMVSLRKTFEVPSRDMGLNYLLTFLVGAFSGWFLILGQ